MSAAQRFRVTVVVVAVCCLVPLGYSVLRLTTHQAPRPAPAPAPTAGARGPAVTDTVLQVMPAPYQLPAPLSREVALPAPGGLLIQGTSTDAVTDLNPATGVTRRVARLAAATHDAAGAILGGQTYLFG